jgi:hypothetical protein
MGKVSEKDFAEMGGRLRARAAGLMRQLDAGAGYRDEIEKEIVKRLGERSQPPVQAPAAEARAHFCSACGTKLDADARFCKHCGAKVEAAS